MHNNNFNPEQQDTPLNYEFKPSQETAEFKNQKNAEAFLKMADEISAEEDVQSMPDLDALEEMPQTHQARASASIDMRARQEAEQRLTQKEQIQSGLPQGPKYMDALKHIIGVADIRAIETELPILRTKVEVSPLTGAEEMALKTAAVSPDSFLKKINELLFNHTKFQDHDFVSFNDFLSSLYPPDKSVLIWALLTSSYLVLPTMEKKCEKCGEKYILEAGPADMLHQNSITKIWDNSLPISQYTEVQTILDGYITVELGIPSEKDRLVITNVINPEQAKSNIQDTGSILSYMDNLVFFTKAIIVGEDQDKIVLTDVIQDIYPFLKNIPPKISDAVKNQIDLSIFDEYMPKFYLIGKCNSCGATEEIPVDPEISFFRKAISL